MYKRKGRKCMNKRIMKKHIIRSDNLFMKMEIQIDVRRSFIERIIDLNGFYPSYCEVPSNVIKNWKRSYKYRYLHSYLHKPHLLHKQRKKKSNGYIMPYERLCELYAK